MCFINTYRLEASQTLICIDFSISELIAIVNKWIQVPGDLDIANWCGCPKKVVSAKFDHLDLALLLWQSFVVENRSITDKNWDSGICLLLYV